MSGNFVSYQDADALMTKIAQKISGGGGGNGWSPHCITHSDTGSTVTVVKGQTTVTAEETSTGIFECDLPDNDYGEWTFNGVVDGVVMHRTVDIKIVQRHEINFINGKTATPINDVTLFLQCAGIYDSEVSTLSDLLADTALFATAISSDNALEYLVRSTGWISDICINQDIMSIIGLNNEATNKLVADETWIVAIVNSNYFESILNLKVPTMTSNTTPEGNCFCSYGSQGWRCFDGNDSSEWRDEDNTSSGKVRYVGYTFTKAVRILAYRYVGKADSGGGTSYPRSYTIQGSNPGGSWNNVKSSSGGSSKREGFTNALNYFSYRLYCTNWNLAGTKNDVAALATLQFYGRVDV